MIKEAITSAVEQDLLSASDTRGPFSHHVLSCQIPVFIDSNRFKENYRN